MHQQHSISNIRWPHLARYPKSRDEICHDLRKQNVAGQLLYAVINQSLIKATLQKRKSQLLEDDKWMVSTKWTKTFIESYLNWNYCATTTTTRKLFEAFEMQGLTLAQRCAYLVKFHNISKVLFSYGCCFYVCNFIFEWPYSVRFHTILGWMKHGWFGWKITKIHEIYLIDFKKTIKWSN